MSRLAVLAPPLTGHWKPLAALAAELGDRGHQVTFIHGEAARGLAERLDADFAPVPSDGLGDHKGVRGTVREMARQTDMLCRHAPAIIRQLRVDGIIADQLEPAGGLIAEHLDLPFASLACALPINREPKLPPPYVGWPYDASPRGESWAKGGWRVSDFLMRPVGAAVARWAETWRLPPRRRLDDCFSPALQIAQAVPSIDFPRERLPASFHHAGPLRRQEGTRSPIAGPFVYCSLGTLQGGRTKIFAAVAAACATLGLKLVLTHCGRLSPAEVSRLPGAPLAFDFLPQEALLKEASLVVTHAGFNTVIESLACGVPMVAIPIAFDQPAVAARVARAGVGEVVTPRRASAARLARAIQKVLGHPRYRERARYVQREIGAAGGVARAADLIEAKLLR
ncbi:MAG TPA: glycosyltransferase [Allosphingosinicella sp.]